MDGMALRLTRADNLTRHMLPVGGRPAESAWATGEFLSEGHPNASRDDSVTSELLAQPDVESLSRKSRGIPGTEDPEWDGMGKGYNACHAGQGFLDRTCSTPKALPHANAWAVDKAAGPFRPAPPGRPDPEHHAAI